MLSTFLIAGCGAGQTGTEIDAPTAPGHGRVALSLSASPIAMNRHGNGRGKSGIGDLSEVIVEIDRVSAHGPDGWVAISDSQVTVDVLRLADFTEELGFAELPAGKINQIRLHVLETSAPYVTRTDGEQSR